MTIKLNTNHVMSVVIVIFVTDLLLNIWEFDFTINIEYQLKYINIITVHLTKISKIKLQST